MPDEVSKRWISEFFSHFHFLFRKAFQVRLSGILDRWFVRGIALNVYLTRPVSPARSASDLNEQLKGALGGSEIFHPQGEVGIHYAH